MILFKMPDGVIDSACRGAVLTPPFDQDCTRNLVYRVFAGDHAGGAIDYTTVIATVATTSYASGSALPVGSHTRFGVRAYDQVTTHDDGNTDAFVEIVVSAGGSDVTSAPLAPQAVVATPVAGGNVDLLWSYPYRDAATAPTGFYIYRDNADGVIDYGSPIATVPYGIAGLSLPTGPATPTLRATVTGLSDGLSYQFAVRPYNSNGTGTDALVTATAHGTAPLNPINLVATLVV